MTLHPVREMKKYGHIRVANALTRIGYYWKNPKRRPTNVEHITAGLPRCDLERVLNILRKNK